MEGLAQSVLKRSSCHESHDEETFAIFPQGRLTGRNSNKRHLN